MASDTTQGITVARGAFAALGNKVHLIENVVTLPATLSAANDRVTVFTFSAETLVIAAGFDVTSVTGAGNGSLGLGASGAGSATDFCGESDMTDATGVYGGTKYPQIAVATSTLVLEVSADVVTAGEARVWALVADVGDVTG